VNAILQDQSGRLWAGTSGGAAICDGENWQALNATDGLADDMVNVMLEDRQGGIWFGSYVAPKGGISHKATVQLRGIKHWKVFID
jgi:ligand-binding sensor domain-containing protein